LGSEGSRATREACAAFVALGLLDAEDERRDGKKTLSERGDLTAILEEYGVTLVMLLDALPEFLSASVRSLALRLKSPGSSAVAEIEQSLRIREIRSAFAFNKVIAKKFHEFMTIHFDAESTEGKALARFGWALYQSVKCETLPAFPDLYSCFHLLVVVEAFLLVNAPRNLLRTSLSNMVSMTTKNTVSSLPDPLASLSTASKTKMVTLRSMSSAVVKVVLEEFPRAVNDADTQFDDVAPSELCVQNLLDAASIERTADGMGDRYRKYASQTFGRLAVDETLYLYSEMEGETSRGKRIIGDLAQCKTATTHGSMATPARRKRMAPFSPIRPKKVPLKGVPPSPFRSFQSINVSVPPATPISQAMESASWLQDIVCGASDVDVKLAQLQKFVPEEEEEVVLKLKKKVEDLGQRVGQAIREDALVSTMRTDISPHSSVMDDLVRERTTEIVHVFFYFLNRILEDERARLDKKDVNFVPLLKSSRFTKSLLICCMEVVVSTYKTSTLAFPATALLLGMHPFDLTTMIEPFVRADLGMPREIQRHLNALEEKTLERLAWCKGSTLFEFLQTYHDTAKEGSSSSASARVSRPKKSLTREPSNPVLSVASIAEVAAMGGTAKESDDDEPLMPQCQSPARRAPSSAFTAFSTPLRGVTTPRRRISGGQTLPESFSRVVNHDVDMPAGCDVCAFKALRMFFMKVMHLAARRVGDLGSRLNLTPEVIRDAYALIEHVVYEQTNLMYNRHVDQIILAAMYGVCKANGTSGQSGPLQFKDIIYQYSKQPQSNEDIFWTVVIEQTDPDLEVTRWGDIISFYNQVFVGRVKDFLLTLRERPKTEIDDENKGNASGSVKTDEPLPFGLSSPRRKLPITNQNIYVSPMRPERITLMTSTPATPRTRSLFATIGESAHSYRMPSQEFEVINRRMAQQPSRFATMEDLM